ncbi:MAG TPA: hypothetical protein VFV01_06965 [Spirillospora sp.]|nr:hypothetical protein [Spirillospora sp.]
MAKRNDHLSPTERARLRELYAERRYVNSGDWYHPAAWYGVPAPAVDQIRTEETRRLTAAIKALTSEPSGVPTAPMQPALF